MDSKRLNLIKWSTCWRKMDLLCFCVSMVVELSEFEVSDGPQNSLGMIFERTAWQKADMLEMGVARSRRE